MLPALTLARPRSPRRLIAGGAAALACAAAIVSQTSAAPPKPIAIADGLRPASWAMTIPSAWLAAPAPRARPGDSFDIVAIRSGDRSYATPIAYDLVVIALDERGLVVQVDEDDAVALANARGSGLSLVALLRSTR